MPASSSARSRSLPAGPTNGRPERSSSFPGCAPRSIIGACARPSPKRAWVARSQRSHARHVAASRRRSGREAAAPRGGDPGSEVRCPRRTGGLTGGPVGAGDEPDRRRSRVVTGLGLFGTCRGQLVLQPLALVLQPLGGPVEPLAEVVTELVPRL